MLRMGTYLALKGIIETLMARTAFRSDTVPNASR
jgi:hypothetical protein